VKSGWLVGGQCLCGLYGFFPKRKKAILNKGVTKRICSLIKAFLPRL
jgi:hypothetical protein